MKKLFSALFILLLIAISLTAIPFHTNAATDGYYTYSISNGEATITDVPESISGVITIPSTLGGCPVTGLGRGAFSGCDSLTSVTIPDSVTSIGDAAFSGCDSLTSINIPDSVTSIGEEAIAYCDSLTGIWVDGNNQHYSNDARGVLFNKDKTILIQAPCAFSGSYVIPDSVTDIGNYAFTECSGLINITIGSSVNNFGLAAFRNCRGLTSVTIEQGVTSIGYSAFQFCTSLTSVNIPDSVTSIGEYAFYNCSSLTGVTIPDSVTSIGDDAFSGCSNLTSVTIPDSVTTIGDFAFYGCSSLTSVTIPDSVTSIGSYAFYNCSRLTSVTYCGTEEQWNQINIGSNNSALTNAKRSYHNWQNITCSAPKTCSICGETTGEAIGHIWQEPTCTAPKKCIFCGVTEGEILGHNLGIYITKTVDFAHANASNYPFTNTDGVWYSTNKTDSTSATYTLTATSSGTVTIEYGVSSESNYDKFTVKLNGTTIATISGSTTGSKTWELSVGDKITFTYSKDGSVSNGSDSGWFKITACRVFDTSVTTQNCTDDVYCDRCNMLIYAAGHNYLDATCTTPKTCTTCDGTEGEALGHSYVAEILEKPTFTTTGQQQKVCSVCGDTVTETLDMLVGEVSGWNVTLYDDLQVNFHLNISQSIESTARVRIVVGEEGHTFRVSGLEKTEDGLYIASVRIAAAQMTDFIFVTVINGSDLAETASYTVRGYAETILADEDFSQYHQLVREMLNYGAAAQVYFDYEKENLANEGVADAGTVEIPDSVDNELSVTGNAEGVTFYGASLIFRNKIAVRYYFRFIGDINDCSFVEKDTTYAPQLKDGLYYIEIKDILPQNLDEEIALTVTDANGNRLTVRYNPMNYIVRMNEKGSAELKALVKALYNYHLAAKAVQETV